MSHKSNNLSKKLFTLTKHVICRAKDLKQKTQTQTPYTYYQASKCVKVNVVKELIQQIEVSAFEPPTKKWLHANITVDT